MPLKVKQGMNQLLIEGHSQCYSQYIVFFINRTSVLTTVDVLHSIYIHRRRLLPYSTGIDRSDLSS